MIRCVVGLGNPGRRYAGTRHNVGFEVLDAVAGRAGAPWRKRLWWNYWRCVAGTAPGVTCCKPATYMNRSGAAVAALRRREAFAPEEVLVVCDDVHLPLGTLRVRARGSAGGHHGLQSVLEALQSERVPRLRIGIGHGGEPRIDHVLGEFTPEERPVVQTLITAGANAVVSIIQTGCAQAAQRVNSWTATQGADALAPVAA